MLVVRGLSVGYGGLPVVRGASLEVRQGEAVALIGPNGAGKTTTLKTILGLLRPSAGSVEYDGERLDGLSPDAVVRHGIAVVPEGRRIFPDLTVEENLRLGAYVRWDRRENRVRVAAMLDLFPALRGRQRQAGGTLSGGEQQMLAIARALMAEPRLLLLDEPSMGLGPQAVEAVFEIITGITARGTTVLLVEQNAELALDLTGRGYVMEAGEISLAGTAAALRDHPDLRRAYLGGPAPMRA